MMGGMRVMTWNLWWRFGPWEARQAAILAVLREVDADVVCLQEVFAEEGGGHQAELLADALGLHHAAAPQPFRNGLAFTNAVLSRWPVEMADTLALPGADGQPGHRHALWCELRSPSGPRQVVSTHLEYPFDRSALRVAQVRALCRLVAERRANPEHSYPVVVGGDLNATPDSDELRLLTGRTQPPEPGLVFTDAWEVAGEGPGWTWDAANPYLAETAWPRRRLDHLLVSWPRPKPLGNPVRCWLAGVAPVDGVQPSDHFAVVAELVEHDPVEGAD
jgi:endonuclease/exonuclease/phosphatase family metal-dependent hydrolase